MPDHASPILIEAADSGAVARIQPGAGFNCFSFQAPVRGQLVEAFWSEPGFAIGEGRPSRSGMPVLFPFAGRIKDARFLFAGKDYHVTTAGENGPNAIHGFVFNRPWRVIETASDRVTGAFQGSIDAPETLRDWPSDYAIKITYTVAGAQLSVDITLSNPGGATLPYVFGLHPYFRVPLGGAVADDCLITVPAARYWPLEHSLPTGEEFPVDSSRDLRTPRRFADLSLDDVLTGMLSDGDQVTTTVEDPGSGIRLRQTASAEYPFYIVFTSPHREAIAIEPYTGSPDLFRAPDLGLDPHLRLLEPGQFWCSHVTITLETI
jgi:aldose 1-epimerase